MAPKGNSYREKGAVLLLFLDSLVCRLDWIEVCPIARDMACKIVLKKQTGEETHLLFLWGQEYAKAIRTHLKRK